MVKSRRMRRTRHVRVEKWIQNFSILVRNLKGRDHLDGLEVDGRITLK
jgi:hypothetical protein